MMRGGSSPTERSTGQVEVAALLWEEYKYRHDLIWRLLFRVTAVAALLSIAPFTIDDVITNEVGIWIKFLPILAFLLVAASWGVLWIEFRLFRPINDHYVRAQDAAVGEKVRTWRESDVFKWIVVLYPGLLLVLTTVVICLVFHMDTPPDTE